MKKKKNSKTTPTVAYVKEKFSPKVPCVNADAEGYCTGPCEGCLCFKCASYNPIKPAPVVPEVVQSSALTVRDIALETPDYTSPAERYARRGELTKAEHTLAQKIYMENHSVRTVATNDLMH